VSARLFPAERIIDQGRGSALVFLHHFGGSARSWSGVIDRLLDRHRCVAPDLPGFGSAAERPGPFRVATTAHYIVSLIEGLGLTNYSLIGHSMGGKIALAVAACKPHGLCDLILLAPSPPTPEPISELDRAQLLASWGNRDAMGAVVDKIVVRALSCSDREQQVDDMLSTSEAAWRDWLNHGSREDISPLLEAIAVPITVVSGEGDQTISATVLRRELVHRMPNATIEIVPDAGHLLPVEARDEVAAIIEHSQKDAVLAGATAIAEVASSHG
jgi:pimeloyl-ACP methyl ester carboxylesterase